MKRPYLHVLADALSQLGNALLGRECNHSICGDAYFHGPRWWEVWWNVVFAWMEPQHCYESHHADIDRMVASIVEHMDKFPQDRARFESLKERL